MQNRLLDVKHLKTNFHTQAGIVQAVRDVSFHVDEEECVGIVGESGCGKSVTMLSVMRLLEENAETKADSILFQGKEISKYSNTQMRNMDGRELSMIFQDPMTSLNPVFTIGFQLKEAIKLHTNRKGKEAEKRAIEMLELVGHGYAIQNSKSEFLKQRFPTTEKGNNHDGVALMLAKLFRLSI